MSEPVRLGEILPDVMRDIQARRNVWNDGQRMGGNMMGTKKQSTGWLTPLNKRQIAVLDDLFAGQLDEQAVLDKYKVSRRLYDKWQGCESFAAEYSRRIAALDRHSGLIIARYASMAAAKLVQLTDSENQETGRKACLDIISLTEKQVKETRHNERDMKDEQLPPETAAKLLAALAEEEV
jgi:hypothetical protein